MKASLRSMSRAHSGNRVQVLEGARCAGRAR